MRNRVRLVLLGVDLCLLAAAVGASLVPSQPPAEAQQTPCAGVGSVAELGSPVLPDGWTVHLDCGASPDGLTGLTDPDAQTITIWPSAHSNLAAAQWTLWHETGHAWDHAAFTDNDRQAWRELRHLGDAPWWWAYKGDWDPKAWSQSPGEDLAEAYAYCHVPHVELARIAGWTPPTRAACTVLDGLRKAG